MADKRVGILGGTFDPPHLGHLLLAETVREDFGLDEVLFIPCNEPPHKDRPDLSDATHRYAMVVAATLHNKAFTPSPVEVNRPGKSYSVDTLAALREELDEGTEIFFVAGLDAFLEIRSWKRYEELLDSCHFVVVSRPDASFDQVTEVLPEAMHDRIVDIRRGEEGAGASAAVPTGGEGVGALRIYLSNAVFLDVSGTEIRARARSGRSFRYRVTPEVERYIRAHELYKRARRDPEAAS